MFWFGKYEYFYRVGRVKVAVRDVSEAAHVFEGVVKSKYDYAKPMKSP